MVNSTTVGGRVPACVAKRTRGRRLFFIGGGFCAMVSRSQLFSRPVETRWSQLSRASSMAGSSFCRARPVLAEMLTRVTHGRWASCRSISRSSAVRRSSSTRSHLLKASTSALPASTTALRMRWSCSVTGSEASMSMTQTSAASIAFCVRSEA